jgi:regulatory protein YycI of two-component signal transduction system YycFG
MKYYLESEWNGTSSSFLIPFLLLFKNILLLKSYFFKKVNKKHQDNFVKKKTPR